MRISRIQNNNQPSFQGWSSASKSKLAQVVAKLPKVQIEEAIGLVNKLEKKSPKHKLCMQYDGIFINTTDWKYNNPSGFTYNTGFLGLKKRSIVDLLKQTDKFIDGDNLRIAKIDKATKAITPKLTNSSLGPKGLSDYGLVFGDNAQRELLIFRIAKLAGEKDGAEKVRQAVKLVRDIDTVAKNTCVRVSNPAYAYSGAYITGGKRTGLYFVDAKIPEKKDILETLKATYKIIIKEADKGNLKYEQYRFQEQAGEERAKKAVLKLEAKKAKQEKIEQFKKAVKEKLSNNPVVEFFKQRAVKKQEQVDKIAQKLNF